jgi:cold-inducible RNA-binding protein
MKNIFVGNLSYETTEHGVRSLFEHYGAVDRVSIVMDRDTGRAKGFGFVEMSNDTEGDQAINALNGWDLDGRALNVNEARPREERGGGFGGGQRRSNGGGGGGFGGQRRNRY